MNRKLLGVTVFHSAFSSFGDIEGNFLSQLSVPLDRLFNESVRLHYGVELSKEGLDTVHSLVASMLFVGILFGGFLTGQFMDTLGRKWLSVYLRGIVGLLSALCAMLSVFLTSVEFFAISHFLSGVGVSLKIVLVIYLSECASDTTRGTVSLMLSSGVAIMQLIVQPLFLPEIFGGASDWPAIAMINVGLCMIHILVASFFPSSPKHLYLNRHQEEQARESLQFYLGKGIDTSEILAEYDRESHMINSEHMKLSEIWKNHNTRLPFIVIFTTSMVAACSAISIKGQYFQSMLVDMGMSWSSASFSIFTLTLATTPFTLLAPSLIEKLGRRPLFLTMSFLCCFEWAFLGLAQWNFGSPIASPVAMIGLSAGNIAFMLGLMNLTPIILNELCPFAAKAKVTEFIQIVPILVSLAVVLLFPPIVHNFGSLFHLTMFAISALLFYLLYKLLPETRLRHVDSAIRELFARRAPDSPTTNHYGSIEGEDEDRRRLIAD